MRRIGGMLGRSPFGPTHEHLLKVIDCLNALPVLVGAAMSLDRDATERAAKEIRALEEQADEVKSAIRMQFTKSFLASVSRSELMALVKAQDDVADECDRLAFELSVRPTRFPDHLADSITDLTAKVAGTGRLLAAIGRLLDESGGRVSSQAAADANGRLEEVRRAVADVDPLYDGLLRRLFERESESAPLDVLFVMRFAEHADRIAKKIENMCDVFTRLIVEGGQ